MQSDSTHGNNSDKVTVLQAAPGFTTAKVIRPDGVQQYNAGEWFAVNSVDVSDIYDLAALLEEVGQPENRMLVIRGELLPGKTAPVQRRKTWFGAAARRWICLDFDSVEVDGDATRDPEGVACEVVERYLPDRFSGPTFYFQYSSRACLGGDRRARLHVWFWLDRPVSDDEAAAWAEAEAPDVDASVFRVVQPHYVARPVFEGVEDPLALRSGVFHGRSDVVLFPLPGEYASQSAVSTPKTYEERMAELGDGEGLGGFHAVLLSGIWTYLARGGRDLDWLKSDLRRRISEAPAGVGRNGDIERYTSDYYLDDSIAGAKRKLAEQREGLRLTRDSLKPFAQRVSRKMNDREAELGRALLSACDGEKFESHLGPRVMQCLAERFDQVNPESIRPVFAPSAQAMRVSLDELVQEFSRAQEEVRQRALFKDEASSARVREAFGNGRDHPYTPGELASAPPRRWILQRARSFYLRFRDTYRGPYTMEEIQNAAVVHLAPASSAGVELFKLGKNGEVIQKTSTELVREYGTVIDRVIADLRAQRASYDEKSRTLTEAPCPLRDIKPVFHEEIHYWLAIMAGSPDKFHKLCCWIASVTWLDRVAVALLLTGKKGSGKSMLAQGLSRLFATTGPTPLKNAFDTFNDDLARCPLCFADEKLPEDFRGWTKNAELRVHIQELERPLKRKFLPVAKLLGATRTIVAANSEDVLATKENLTASDVDAISDRYFHIHVNPQAHEFLKLVDTWADGGWVEGDKIAEHALWLRDNYKWEAKGRFLIEVDDDGLHASLATRTGVSSAVCQWLVSYLQDPNRFHGHASSQLHVRKKNGKLLVNVRGILRCWDLYVGNEKCPSTGILSRAMKGLCSDGRLQYPDSRGIATAYRIIDLKFLSQWAVDKGFIADEDELKSLVAVDTEEQVMSLKLN